MTDEVRLKQIVINLISNAIKFTDRGGSVRMTAGVRSGSACFEIADTGPGMTAEEIEKALKPFIQVGNPMHRRQGTGLGLPLSRQLAGRLGGTFDIASTPGVGTTVTITLPLEVEEITP